MVVLSAMIILIMILICTEIIIHFFSTWIYRVSLISKEIWSNLEGWDVSYLFCC